MDNIMDYKMVMLLLINGAIYEKNVNMLEEIWREVDWAYVKEESYQHNCKALIFPAVKRIQEEYNCIDEELYKQWEEETIVLGAAQCIKNYEIKDVLEQFGTKKVGVVVFKGPILADLYPEPLLRVAGDMDLLVDKKDEEKAIEILCGMGYEINKAASKDNVTVLSKGDILVIELHASLWEDYTGAHIDKIKKMGLEDSRTFIKFKGSDVECETLETTNHFIYIFYHMVKHFIPGGIGIRHLIDITLFYNKYEEKIDMDIFRKSMETLGYSIFYRAIFSLCIAHLGMKKSCLQDGFILEAELYDKILHDIIDAGVFGNRTINRIKSRNIVKQTYYQNEAKNNATRGKVIINTLFPSADSLSDRYVNAKKYRILLPVAWTQRAFYYMKNKMQNSEEPDVFEKTKLVEERMALLKELGL